MDLINAFTFVFQDKAWPKKILIGILISLTSILIIPGLIVTGYVVEVAQRVNNGEADLPEWNKIGEKIVKGLQVILFSLVYVFPWALIFIFISRNIWPIFLIGFSIFHPVIVSQFVRNGTVTKVYKDIARIFRVHFLNFLLVAFAYVAVGLIAQATGRMLLIQLPKNIPFTLLNSAFTIAILPGFYGQLVLFNLYGQFAKNTVSGT